MSGIGTDLKDRNIPKSHLQKFIDKMNSLEDDDRKAQMKLGLDEITTEREAVERQNAKDEEIKEKKQELNSTELTAAIDKQMKEAGYER